MEPETFTRLELNLPQSSLFEKPLPKTPSEWFALKFPEAVNRFGCPFLEMRQTSCDGFLRIVPVSINLDFFAAMLGGDSGLGHSVIYFEPEMQWYFRDLDNIFKPTTVEVTNPCLFQLFSRRQVQPSTLGLNWLLGLFHCCFLLATQQCLKRLLQV